MKALIGLIIVVALGAFALDFVGVDLPGSGFKTIHYNRHLETGDWIYAVHAHDPDDMDAIVKYSRKKSSGKMVEVLVLFFINEVDVPNVTMKGLEFNHRKYISNYLCFYKKDRDGNEWLVTPESEHSWDPIEDYGY